MKTLETQIKPLALAIKDQCSRLFPSDIENNPKECKTVTLRSGKDFPSPKVSEEDKVETEEVPEKKQKEVEKVVPSRMVFSGQPSYICSPPPLLFP